MDVENILAEQETEMVRKLRHGSEDEDMKRVRGALDQLESFRLKIKSAIEKGTNAEQKLNELEEQRNG